MLLSGSEKVLRKLLLDLRRPQDAEATAAAANDTTKRFAELRHEALQLELYV